MLRSALFGALALVAAPALAEPPCADLAIIRGAVAERGGRWIEAAPEQFEFLRGVYMGMPPQSGLPIGGKAALVEIPGEDATVFFIDGAKACTPMTIPKATVAALKLVGAGEIVHEGVDN